MAKNKKPGKKYQPNKNFYQVTTPLFKLTKEQSDNINRSIRKSFDKMKTGVFNQTQWLDLLTRMVVGKLMIAKHYDESSALQFAPCVDVLEQMEVRASEDGHKTWIMTKDEEETLEAGLEAVEQIQVEVTRLDFLNAHRDADKEISKLYIKRRDSIEAGLALA